MDFIICWLAYDSNDSNMAKLFTIVLGVKYQCKTLAMSGWASHSPLCNWRLSLYVNVCEIIYYTGTKPDGGRKTP